MIELKESNRSTKTFYILITIFSIIAVIHLYACFNHILNLRYATKVFLVPLLLLIYLQRTSKETRSNFTIIALTLGALGDILIICKFFKFYLLLGLSSFLIGHYFYIIELISRIKMKIWKEKSFIALLFLMCFGLFFSYVYKYFMEEGVKKHKFVIPGIAYLATLGILDSTALFYLISKKTFNSLIIYIGAIFFSISDLILGRNLFYKENIYFSFFIMLTYIIAQVLITFGLSRAD